jgi:Zn-dependent M28 family amino/carboxypeptidase
VPGLSGANDNASGAVILLTIAELLADAELPYTLRIMPFGGLLGSRFYVQELSSAELENTKLTLIFMPRTPGQAWLSWKMEFLLI